MESPPRTRRSFPRPACDEALRSVVDHARSVLPRCTAAGVTVVQANKPVVVVGSCLLGLQLEEAQWTTGHGPGLDAMRQLQVFNVDSLASARSWPEFVKVALGRSVRSALAVPVTGHGRALGALTVYAPEPKAFAGCEAVALECAAAAGSVLVGMLSTWADEDNASDQLDDSETDRAVS